MHTKPLNVKMTARKKKRTSQRYRYLLPGPLQYDGSNVKTLAHQNGLNEKEDDMQQAQTPVKTSSVDPRGQLITDPARSGPGSGSHLGFFFVVIE
jgi:hypothetical protein